MKLIHLIRPERVFCGLKATNLSEAIRLLVPRVLADRSEQSQKAIIDEVLEREKLVSTIAGRGIALPHARSNEISELVVGIGIFPDGLGDHTPDGEPLRIIFLLLEQKKVSKLYLKTLGVLARLALSEEIHVELASASSPSEVLNAIKKTNLLVTERLYAGDIARRVETLREDMNLKEAADLFFRNETLTLPVLDAENEVVGILRCYDLLQAAMPEYARMIGDLRFISEFEPFDRFLQEEDKMPVSSVMVRDFAAADDSASIIEITSVLLHRSENALVVTKEGKYFGVVSLRDIITKVMRT
ncbi:PTS transporter subunit EIIA [bacterium]|nr:PTS transporter subunit EIIA [bacterium]